MSAALELLLPRHRSGFIPSDRFDFISG